MADWKTIDEEARSGEPIMLGLHYGPHQKFVRYIGVWNKELNVWARDEFGSTLFPAHMQSWFEVWQPLPEPPTRSSSLQSPSSSDPSQEPRS